MLECLAAQPLDQISRVVEHEYHWPEPQPAKLADVSASRWCMAPSESKSRSILKVTQLTAELPVAVYIA